MMGLVSWEARDKQGTDTVTDEFDVQVAVNIARKAQSMFTVWPFDSIISTAFLDVAQGASDAIWEAWYKSTAYVRRRLSMRITKY